jgi:hypothetical protein
LKVFLLWDQIRNKARTTDVSNFLYRLDPTSPLYAPLRELEQAMAAIEHMDREDPTLRCYRLPPPPTDGGE